jgi:cellulose synthase/poly-beta-1,6-N-acetylglucosamine synthase-like glycosyltransferase
MIDLSDKLTLFFYFGAFAFLLAYGVNRYFIAYLFILHRKYREPTPKPFTNLPFVTVQLPVFNERYVVQRLIESVSRLDYPRHLLEIQVLDDSTDETKSYAKKAVEEIAGRGINIVHLHRKNREGFKAGALNHGLKLARGELVAIFDADFIPPEDFLKKTIHYFSDSSVGMVQARWGHLNRKFSMFTALQSILLDGHFFIEQTARSRSGRFINFNGTAGIWRKNCLLDAGSWQYDTLTEDLDISYRAQLKGWKFIYLKDFTVQSELPVEMNAFKSQQHRWAKGSVQTAIKLLPAIVKSKIPWKVKLESIFHLTNNASYPLIVTVAILMFPTMVIRFSHGWIDSLLIDVPLLIIATISVIFFFSLALNEITGNRFEKLLRIPLLMGLEIGMSLNNTIAVLEALLGNESEFKRTPKFGVRNKGDVWKEKVYQSEISYTTIGEIIIALYFALSLALALEIGIYLSVPFLLLFLLGFSYVPAVSIYQTVQRKFIIRFDRKLKADDKAEGLPSPKQVKALHQER